MTVNETAVQIGKMQFVTTTESLSFDSMDYRSCRLMAAIAIGWTLGEPMESVEVVSTRGRVAIVSVDPVRQPDPILPVVLANVAGDWRGHLNNWYFHQLEWRHNRHRRDYRMAWFAEGGKILGRLLAHAQPHLTPDEFRFLSLELAAVLVLPEEPR
jgi:hypothetical protein